MNMMKTKNILGLFAVLCILMVSGCGNDSVPEDSIEDIVEDSTTVIEKVESQNESEDMVDTVEDPADADKDAEESQEKNMTTEEMIEKLSKEKGLIEDEDSESESSENESDSTASTGTEIVIEGLSPSPENLNINAGDTVTWTSKQKNYRHIIMVRSIDESGSKDEFAGPFVILYGESANLTFEEPGKYDYYSKPCYEAVNGEIVVSE